LRQAGRMSHLNDPVLFRRKRLARLAQLGQRCGYCSYLVAVVIFVIGFITSFTNAVAISLVILLIGGSFFLAPSIVLHHAVKAADDLDKE